MLKYVLSILKGGGDEKTYSYMKYYSSRYYWSTNFAPVYKVNMLLLEIVTIGKCSNSNKLQLIGAYVSHAPIITLGAPIVTSSNSNRRMLLLEHSFNLAFFYKKRAQK